MTIITIAPEIGHCGVICSVTGEISINLHFNFFKKKYPDMIFDSIKLTNRVKITPGQFLYL